MAADVSLTATLPNYSSGLHHHPCLGFLIIFFVGFSIAGCRHSASADATWLWIREEMHRGQLDAALRDVDSAGVLYGLRDSEWAARFRVQKGHILMLRGSYLESLQFLRDPLPPSLLRTDTEVEREVVQGLAYKYLQQFENADRSIREAEVLALAIHSSLISDVAHSRGMFELDQKNYAQAGVAFRKVLDLARQQKEPFREVLALGSLGNVAMGDEHYDEASGWFHLALQKARSVGSLSSESIALGNLGWSYSAVGDFDNAEESFQGAQTKASQAGLVEDQTYWLISLADIYSQQRRYREAESIAREALALADKHDDKNTLTTCLNTLSEIALATGRPIDAETFNRRAADIENAGLDQFGINYSQLIAGRIAAGKRSDQAAQAAFQRVLADPKAETPLVWEAHARLAEVYAAEHQPARAEQEFDIAIRTVQQARDSIKSNEFRVSFLSAAIEFYDAYVNFLINQHRPLDALKIADLSRAQSLDFTASGSAASKSTGFLNLQATARQLNASVLFYWLGRQKSWLWAITPAKTSLIRLPPSAEFDELVKSYRLAFLEPRDPLEAGNAEGQKLYAMMIQPAEKIIARNSRVIVLPDGEPEFDEFRNIDRSRAVAALLDRRRYRHNRKFTFTPRAQFSLCSSETTEAAPGRRRARRHSGFSAAVAEPGKRSACWKIISLPRNAQN